MDLNKQYSGSLVFEKPCIVFSKKCFCFKLENIETNTTRKNCRYIYIYKKSGV